MSYLCSAPYTLLPLRGISPQGETRDMERKTGESYTSCTIPVFPPPLVAGATTFPPQFGGAAKGKRLNGQARRLTSPHVEVLCRTSTGDYKAPLCCELLMKRVFRGVLFCPLNWGKSGEAGYGEANAASQSAECLLCHMTLKVNPVTLTL